MSQSFGVTSGSAVREPSGAGGCEDAPRLRVLTYNVNFAHARWAVERPTRRSKNTDVVLGAIHDVAADIVLLQETHEGWEVLVRKRFGEQYPHQRWIHRGAAGGSALVSRHPIIDMRIVDVRKEVEGSWFEQMVASIRVAPNAVVVVGNLHLRPPINENGGAHPLSMRWTSSIRELELQRVMAEIEELRRAAIDADAPQYLATLVCGDFNESDGYRTSVLMKERGMSDALDRTSKHTHWWPLRFGPLTYTLRHRLDHIWFNEAEAVVADLDVFSHLEGAGSDHFPVFADVMLRRGDELV